MKILRVISSMDPKGGGPCQGIRNSIPALLDLGVHNEVVCLDDPKSDYLGNDTFNIHAIGPAKGPWAYSKKLIPWLKTNTQNFDVIIVHGLWQFSSFAVYKVFNTVEGLSKPYYVMPHGMLDPYFQKAPTRRIKAIRNWLFWKVIESKVVNHAAGILFTCQEELLLARQTFKPYKPLKELNVGYGIQEPEDYNLNMTKAFKLKCEGLKNRSYLLFLSRIHQKKGLDQLIEAYSKLRIETNQKDLFDLVIAGPGLENTYGKGLQEKVANNKAIKNHIHFTGMLSGDAKWGAFYEADAFVLTSHQENFGIAIVEALACGKPVLISNKVNIWREILEGKAGFVANDSLSGALELISNWEQLNQADKNFMEKQAKEIFSMHYAILPAAKRLYETLKKDIEQI